VHGAWTRHNCKVVLQNQTHEIRFCRWSSSCCGGMRPRVVWQTMIKHAHRVRPHWHAVFPPASRGSGCTCQGHNISNCDTAS